jgi:tRNA pseudouridine38-40 synthase
MGSTTKSRSYRQFDLLLIFFLHKPIVYFTITMANKRKWWANRNKGDQGKKEENCDDGGDSDDHADDRISNNGMVHPGSFTMDELKLQADYARRVDSSSFPKKKWAVNFGYVGTSYQGLQINPGADSVEKHVERALFLGKTSFGWSYFYYSSKSLISPLLSPSSMTMSAGGIAECNWGCLNKIQWSRTARTDRGVHAVMQCCAMKLLMAPSGRESFITNVNSFLPPDIRVHTASKVTKNFNGKLSCSGRKYEYLLPTYMFQDKDVVLEILQTALEQQGQLPDVARPGGYAEPGSDRFLGPHALDLARQSLIPFRIDASRLETIRAALHCYEGTKMYHNFTTGKTPMDANAKRYITSFRCSDPFLDNSSETEWVVLSVEGQSFLLNQIRKMVGLVCEVAAGKASIKVAQDSLTAVKVPFCFLMRRLECILDRFSPLFRCRFCSNHVSH